MPFYIETIGNDDWEEAINRKERKKDHLFSQHSTNIHYFTLLVDYTYGDRRMI
jgi:hypothetical protein